MDGSDGPFQRLDGRIETTVVGTTAMKTLVNRFVKDESGATAIEYGLIAALMAVVLITAMQTLGTGITGSFGKIAGHLNKVQ